MKANLGKSIEFLLARGSLPILYWLKRDILDVPVDRESRNLRKYATRVRILETQKPDGYWWDKRSDTPLQWQKTLYRMDTLRNLYRLYDYGCTVREDGILRALNFLFSLQAKEGDFRGTVVNEHTPTFHALVLEIVCRYGLDKDRRVQKGFRWLQANRQRDGGWAHFNGGLSAEKTNSSSSGPHQRQRPPFKPAKSQPSSHHVTGMILRAFAASPTWKKTKQARQAGELLLSSFFQQEVWGDRIFRPDWDKICYPFWNSHILSSLDALSKLGFSREDGRVQKGLDWLLKKQNSQGFWECGNNKTTMEDHLWVTLAVLGVLKRFDLLRA